MAVHGLDLSVCFYPLGQFAAFKELLSVHSTPPPFQNTHIRFFIRHPIDHFLQFVPTSYSMCRTLMDSSSKPHGCALSSNPFYTLTSYLLSGFVPIRSKRSVMNDKRSKQEVLKGSLVSQGSCVTLARCKVTLL